jgi:queuosine precursor transporter
MMNTKVEQTQPRYLWFLIITYSMVLVLSNWFDPRLVHIFGLDTDAGTLIFPLSFLLADLITEVYGYKHARRAIWIGFLFNMIFILYGQLVIHLPSPSYHTNNKLFDTILACDTRIIFASTISYFTSEPLNVFLLAKLKISSKGRFMWLRFVSSTFIASGIDSFIFGPIAFYGAMNNKNLLALILTMWFIKVAIEIFGLPFSVFLAKKLKKAEQLDIYDDKTTFGLFSLDGRYSRKDNHYPKSGS